MQHTIVMTGASRGIGRIAAEDILNRSENTHLVVVARSDAGGVQLTGELAGGGRAVSYVTADLASRESTQHAATELRRRLGTGELPPLRGFVGNAGMQYTNALTTCPDGLEATFAINVLANHLFIRTLQDQFIHPGRIVVTVSDTHFGDFKHNMGMVPAPVWRSPAVLARPGAFDNPATTTAGRTAYSTSKLAAIYLVHEHARQLPTGIDILAYNPGFVPGTDLARNADPVSRFAMRYVMPAMTITPFATSRAAAGRYLADVVLDTTQAPTGAYIDRNRAEPSSKESYDPRRERELWSALEQLAGAHIA